MLKLMPKKEGFLFRASIGRLSFAIGNPVEKWATLSRWNPAYWFFFGSTKYYGCRCWHLKLFGFFYFGFGSDEEAKTRRHLVRYAIQEEDENEW